MSCYHIFVYSSPADLLSLVRTEFGFADFDTPATAGLEAAPLLQSQFCIHGCLILTVVFDPFTIYSL